MNTDNGNFSGKANTGRSFEKQTYTVSEIASILQIGKSKAYEICKDGSFRTVKIGRAVRISKASFDEWLNNQMK